MNTNLGVVDRIIRFVLVLVFFVIGSLYVDGWMRLVLYTLSLGMVISFTTGFCFVYKLIGISTNGGVKKK